MPWLIALDIDGTTIHFDGHLSDRVRAAIRAVADAGHHVVLATGRSTSATLPIAAELGLTHGPAVCANGAITILLDPGVEGDFTLLQATTFDPAPVLGRLRGTWPDALVAVEVPGIGHLVSARFPDGELMADQIEVEWDELGAHPATRVTFRSPSGTAEDFVALAERIGLHGVNYAVGFTAWLDINPDGVSKASALEDIRTDLGVGAAHTLAVGDQRNDVEMLQWAARGVAMGQAPQEVQDVADEVTATVEDDGLAVVLEAFLAAEGPGLDSTP
ncbi:HAD family hydrolase [Demetria terragena]|uniref:HAD family hydrolase n=1 Tax=Demetria terragena TaxID=63959 RepID=UPI00038107C1|nr:HAD hydrolase family protein [Demetria terragena]